MKKAFSILLCLAMILSLMAGCSSGEKPAAANSGETYKIALITMDSIDQHWITLKEGAEKAAAELGVELTFMAPNTKDDALQIEQVNRQQGHHRGRQRPRRHLFRPEGSGSRRCEDRLCGLSRKRRS